MNKANCLVCDKPLIYLDDQKEVKCKSCGKQESTQVTCEAGHYICDACHSLDAFSFIQQSCLESTSKNPVEIAEFLFKHPEVKMHGPEHHYLVPAVLLAATYNTQNKPGYKDLALTRALKRAKQVPGGFCGFHGACGAAIGTGIFYSVFTNTKPVSDVGWKEANLLTARALTNIAQAGGPRCCKRDSYIAINTSASYLKDSHNIQLETKEEIKCKYSHLNKECLYTDCMFFDAD